MPKKSKLDLYLYTLCVEGTPIAICALERGAIEKDAEGAIRAAFFETWSFGGGDIKQLVGRATMARPPTKSEREIWEDSADTFGKPFLVLGGGDQHGTLQ